MQQGEETRLSQEQMNTAIKSPEQLKKWLLASGRQWIVLNGEEVIDSLPYPNGHDALMQVLMAYRDHRSVMPSGEFRIVQDPAGNDVRETLMKGERLTLAELDRCIRSLVGEATQLDSTWSLENPAL